MIRTFLEKCQEELTARKIELNEDYELLVSKIKENEKFLDLLHEEESTVFSDFTPHNVNYKNQDRIHKIQQTLLQLNQDKQSIKSEMDQVHGRLKDCQKAMTEWDEQSSVSSVANDVSCENKEDLSIQNLNQEKMHKMKMDLEQISGYVISDPRRAKTELDHIISTMK